jgi:hypothetical protein
MSATGWPFPPMYQFLVDEFRTHLANAEHARAASDQESYLVELEKARSALRDFKSLLAEFKRNKAH